MAASDQIIFIDKFSKQNKYKYFFFVHKSFNFFIVLFIKKHLFIIFFLTDIAHSLTERHFYKLFGLISAFYIYIFSTLLSTFFFYFTFSNLRIAIK